VKEPQIVAVYVRKGEAEERLLSFRIPKSLPQGELLTHGFALDGDTAIRSIPRTGPGGTFAERLFAAQQDITTWLAGHGYTVEFR
jgi:hypothetical protein